MKKICFLLPGPTSQPAGGYKVVYEYANRLAKDGYKVSIYYANSMFCVRYSLLQRFKKVVKFFLYSLSGMFRVKWFHLGDVKEVFGTRYNKRFLSSNDILICSFIDTAIAVHELGLDKTNKCMYLIQDFESWIPFTEKQVYESYKFNMKKIVVSPWLLNKVYEAGEQATLIYNGLDFDYFSLSEPIRERNPFEIAVMYHERPSKRFSDSFAALKIVKKRYPLLHVNMFGVFKKPVDFPDWISYYEKPSKELHNSIYNKSAIYIAASDIEGFGLTVAEAMICGCAIACTDNEGFKCMVEHEKTGLLSPIYDYEALAANIVLLIENKENRFNFAENGNKTIKKFNWEIAYKQFKDLIEE